MAKEKFAGLVYGTNEETGHYGRRWVEFTMDADAPIIEVDDRADEIAFRSGRHFWMMEDNDVQVVGYHIFIGGECMTDGEPLNRVEMLAELAHYKGWMRVEARMFIPGMGVNGPIVKPTTKASRRWSKANN